MLLRKSRLTVIYLPPALLPDGGYAAQQKEVEVEVEVVLRRAAIPSFRESKEVSANVDLG